MRIYDEDKDRVLDSIILYLTQEEAYQLKSSLKEMIEQPDKHQHTHIDDEEYQHEITVTIYGDDLSSYDARSRKLILEDC